MCRGAGRRVGPWVDAPDQAQDVPLGAVPCQRQELAMVVLGQVRAEQQETRQMDLAGGKTANVLFSGLRKGTVGVYEVHLELNADLPTNPKTNVTIAQSFQVSNIFTIPLVNPNPDAEQ